jgi:hypothetical protein
VDELHLGADDLDIAAEGGDTRFVRAGLARLGVRFGRDDDAVVPGDAKLFRPVGDVIEQGRLVPAVGCVEDRLVEAAESALSFEHIPPGRFVDRDAAGAVDDVLAVHEPDIIALKDGAAPPAVDLEGVGEDALPGGEAQLHRALGGEMIEVGIRPV